MKGIQYLNSLAEWNGRSGFSREKIIPILTALGSPQDKVPTVLVAGTNGKGSVSAMCAAALASLGNKVGLTTSPHLSRPNERIVIRGLPVEDEILDGLLCRVKENCDKYLISLSYFEILICAAFLAFAEEGLDWGVVEVGLGGRHDATNVMRTPAAAAIVTIDFDHQEFLGATRYLIAREKAAIARPGVPLILGSLDDEAMKGVEQESQSLSPLVRWGKEYGVIVNENGDPEFWWRSHPPTHHLRPSLRGAHQIHNTAVSLAILGELGVDLGRCAEGLTTVFWPGRLEEVQVNGHRVVLDAAHNVAGMEALRNFVSASAPVRACLGVVADKDWRAMVRVIAPIVGEWWLFAPRSSRALAPRELADFLSSIEIKVPHSRIRIFDGEIEQGVDELRVRREGECAITVVAGSIFLMSAFREALIPGPILFWNQPQGVESNPKVSV